VRLQEDVTDESYQQLKKPFCRDSSTSKRIFCFRDNGQIQETLSGKQEDHFASYDSKSARLPW
jgi:hypothetical protein